MKITLDHKALERLLGGDTEAEVELRNCVVQEFTNKHLKGLVNSDAINLLTKTVNQLVISEVKHLVGEVNWDGKVTINKNIKAKIESSVNDQVSALIKNEVGNLKSNIEARIRGYEADYIKYLDSKFDEAITEIVDQRVAAKLNAIKTAI